MGRNHRRAKRPAYLRYGELAVPDVNSRYVRPDHRASTLDELRDRCGPLGPQAVVAAEYNAVIAWLAKMDLEEVRRFTRLGRNGAGYAAANANNIIRLGEAKPLPKDMTPPQRSRLAAAAAEVVAAYRRAGSPGLLKHIHSTQHFVHSCAVNAALEEAQPEGEGQ